MVTSTQEGQPHAKRRDLPDLYFSCDVEADGPIPGPYSMASIGLSCVASYDGDRFQRRDPRADTFYRELQPISERWLPDALAVSGLTREHLFANGQPPELAMPELAAWVRQVARGFNPVFVAYPLGFDWMFTYWYLVQYGTTPGKIDNSPFSFSQHLDVKTLYATKARLTVGRAVRAGIPEHLRSSSPHTHNALDDAIEQGETFCNLMEWPPA
jgi:hypothetical protein